MSRETGVLARKIFAGNLRCDSAELPSRNLDYEGMGAAFRSRKIGNRNFLIPELLDQASPTIIRISACTVL